MALIDDFHNIHGYKSIPSGQNQLKTSQALHMATILLGVLPIPPLQLPSSDPKAIHRYILANKVLYYSQAVY